MGGGGVMDIKELFNNDIFISLLCEDLKISEECFEGKLDIVETKTNLLHSLDIMFNYGCEEEEITRLLKKSSYKRILK